MSTRNSRKTHSQGRSVLTPIALLAVAGLAGCATKAGDASIEAKANRATVSIDSKQVNGSHTQQWYRTQGDKIALPERWVAEARSATAETQAERAAAQSELVKAEADKSERLAQSQADHEAAQRDYTIGHAEARMTREVYQAKLAELDNTATAGQKTYEADDQRNESLLNANVKQWQAEVERMRSRTEADWGRSLAEHEQMLSRREAVEKRGRTTVDQMNHQADLTEQRAASRVSELRGQSRSVTEQTDATVKEVNSSIKTEQEKATAEVADLRQQASSLRIQATAEVNDLTAEADALQKMDVDQVYNVKMVGAKSEFDKQNADAEQLRLTAIAMKTTSSAEIDRRRGEAKKTLEDARTDYTDALSKSQTVLQKSVADVAIARAQADRLEREARARFVKAEIDARVGALREEATHQNKIAEAEFDKVRSEVEAQALKIQTQVAKDVAEQTARGSVSLPGNTAQPKPAAASNDPVPGVTQANAKPTIVAPEHTAAFKTALAEVAMLRTQANSAERTCVADNEQRVGGVSAWWKEQVAAHDASIAEIEGLERKMVATSTEMANTTDSKVASAASTRTKAEVDAAAFRKETTAKITTLQARAEAISKKTAARVALLMTQSDATERNGKSRLEALSVKRDATLRRGTAMAQQLLTEADSLESSQHAVVAQLREEVRSAESILNSELARMDRSAKSFVEVAQANYDEGKVNANTFEKISVANAGELQAQNLAARKTAQAGVEFVRNLATSGELLAQAEVARADADADHSMAAFNAHDMITKSAIETGNRIAVAAADTRFASADAKDSAINAQFDARVAMTESDRNRAYAKLYLDGKQQAAWREQAMAKADAYRDLSNSALARLEAAGVSFSRTASYNWDSRLAMPTPLPAVESVQALNSKAQKDLHISPVQPTLPAVKLTGVSEDESSRP